MVLVIPVPEQPRFVGNKSITGTLTVSGQILLPALGSDSTPDLAFAVAPTTGLRRFTSSIIGVVIGGSAKAVFNGNSVVVASTGKFSWAQSGAPNDTEDLILTRSAIASMNIGGQANGQQLGVKTLTELTTIAAAATTDTAIQLPANALILGVSVRVTTVIPTATTFTVGDAGSAARFSTAAVSVAAGSTDPGTKAGAYYNAAAAAVRITPNGTPGAATGAVRVTIHYLDVTPASS